MDSIPGAASSTAETFRMISSTPPQFRIPPTMAEREEAPPAQSPIAAVDHSPGASPAALHHISFRLSAADIAAIDRLSVTESMRRGVPVSRTAMVRILIRERGTR